MDKRVKRCQTAEWEAVRQHLIKHLTEAKDKEKHHEEAVPDTDGKDGVLR